MGLRRYRWWIAGTLVAVLSTLTGVFIYHYDRLFHDNFKTVVEGEVYRSAQPSPEHLREWKQHYGVAQLLEQNPEFQGNERKQQRKP